MFGVFDRGDNGTPQGKVTYSMREQGYRVANYKDAYI